MTSMNRQWLGQSLIACVGVLALVGCTQQTASDDVPAIDHQSTDSGAMQSHDEHEEHGDSAGHGVHREHGEHGEHGEYGDSTAASLLLSPADLPPLYVEGHAHEGEAPPKVGEQPKACTTFDDLLGTEHVHSHDAAAVSFSKSHFGPTVTETLVDHGGPTGARQAWLETRRAANACDVYVDAVSGFGADRYRVTQLDPRPDAPPGAYFRLSALGRDFQGIRWDVWFHDCDGMLASVSHRSAPGGNNADFWVSVEHAMDKLHDH